MNEVAPDILLSPEQSELKPLCLVSTDEVACDAPITPERIEPESKIKPSCFVSVDEVVDDTPKTPERIEPEGVSTRSNSVGNLRSSNPKVKVQARYLDSSSGSCHDFCKYGHKNLRESTSSFIIKHKRKLIANSKLLSEPSGETPTPPRVATKAKLSISPEKFAIKRSSPLSTPGSKSDKKFNDILRKGVVTQVNPTRGLLSNGKKKELVPPNAPLSSKSLIRRELSAKSPSVNAPKDVSRLERHTSVGKGETKQPLKEKISEEKKLEGDGNETQGDGKSPFFENKKGKQKSAVAVTTRSSLISRNKSLGPKGDQNALSKATKRQDRVSIFERSGTKTQHQMPQKKTELVSWPKRVVGKKVGLEENNTTPRRLKFKPRKAVIEDLNGKVDGGASSKAETGKQMTNHKVGINTRLKRVGEVGVEGRNESSGLRLDFEKGKTIDVQPKNTAPRRLKFKPRKVIVDNVNGDYSRRSLKKVFGIDEVKGSNTEHLRVVLKHQDVGGKKDVQSLLNNVIEEAATRLVRLRKSKVKALVGAFESVMSLPDAKLSTTSAS